MAISSRFQSTTDCPEPRAKATDAGGLAKSRPVAAAAGAATPATTAAAARKTAIFRVLRLLRCTLRVGIGWGIHQQGPGHGGAGSLTNTGITGEVFNQPGEATSWRAIPGARCGTTGNA